MRKSIFEKANQNNTVTLDVSRIIILSENENIISDGFYSYTLKGFFRQFCFPEWANRGHCIDLDDFLSLIDYSNTKALAKNGIDLENSLLDLIELIYNFWVMADDRLTWLSSMGKTSKRYKGFYLIKTIMDDVLAQYNQKPVINKEAQQVLIIEDKPEVTAVAEIIKEELVTPVIKYNHRTLKGDLDTKKAILISLYHELEPKQKVINSFNNKLEDNLFYLCNNLDIRHNNVNDGHGKYKEFVANMDAESLEEWYDELYQMMLLAFLAIDDIENRRQKVNKLKRDIEGE